jgi:hypothetical protein
MNSGDQTRVTKACSFERKYVFSLPASQHTRDPTYVFKPKALLLIIYGEV